MRPESRSERILWFVFGIISLAIAYKMRWVFVSGVGQFIFVEGTLVLSALVCLYIALRKEEE